MKKYPANSLRINTYDITVKAVLKKTYYRFISEAAKLRASASLSKYSCKEGFSI